MAESKEKLPLIITNLEKLKVPKRICAYCKKRKDRDTMFITPISAFCNRDHAAKYAYKNKDKGADKIHREKKKEFKANDKSLRTREAQKAFNAYIRYRDRNFNCISCNRNTGAKTNAGHYKSVGSSPELRFEELNVHLQCEHCNSFKSGNIENYRINLIKKIGLNKVEWLEGPHEQKKYTCEQLKNIELTYKRRLKEFQDD